MNNLQILELIKKEYNPKTAFGNKILIDLMNKIIEPNAKGEFEIDAELTTRIWMDWQCPNCGRYREEDFDNDEIRRDDIIIRTCSCGKKHKLTII